MVEHQIMHHGPVIIQFFVSLHITSGKITLHQCLILSFMKLFKVTSKIVVTSVRVWFCTIKARQFSSVFPFDQDHFMSLVHFLVKIRFYEKLD